MKKILLILTSMLLSVMLSACGTNVDDISGTYKLTEIQVDDVSVKKGDKLWNLTYGEDGGMIIELKGNGEGVLRMLGLEDESFEYTIDGEKIIMTNEGDVVNGVIKNNEIQFRNWESQLLIFEKND